MMTKQPKSAQAAMRLKLFSRYGVLVEVAGDLPVALPPTKHDLQNEGETFNAWCKRVLGFESKDVTIWAPNAEFAPQARIRTLQTHAPASAIREVISASRADGTAAANRKLIRAKDEISDLHDEVTAKAKRVRRASDSLARREKTSTIDRLPDDLDEVLSKLPAMDEILLKQVDDFKKGLEQAQPLAKLIADLLQFAQGCRKALVGTKS